MPAVSSFAPNIVPKPTAQPRKTGRKVVLRNTNITIFCGKRVNCLQYNNKIYPLGCYNDLDLSCQTCVRAAAAKQGQCKPTRLHLPTRLKPGCMHDATTISRKGAQRLVAQRRKHGQRPIQPIPRPRENQNEPTRKRDRLRRRILRRGTQWFLLRATLFAWQRVFRQKQHYTMAIQRIRAR